MIGRCDVTFGSHLFSEIIGIIRNDLLNLFDYSPRPQNTPDDTVNEGHQSNATDDETHEIVQREQ